jgi:hypothetical protein
MTYYVTIYRGSLRPRHYETKAKTLSAAKAIATRQYDAKTRPERVCISRDYDDLILPVSSYLYGRWIDE